MKSNNDQQSSVSIWKSSVSVNCKQIVQSNKYRMECNRLLYIHDVGGYVQDMQVYLPRDCR